MKKKPEALLLIGPTGAGKTPLGDYLEAKGLAGQRCSHFDFGANLRAAASGALPGVEETERQLVQDLLKKGALLENEHFGVAAKILEAFRSDRGLGEGDLLVLNGLPRHARQADAVDRIASIRALVELRCRPETVHDRIRHNAGGDRLGRIDDEGGQIARKLALYETRTQPLVERYAQAGVPVCSFIVDLHTKPAEIHGALESWLG